MNQFAHTHTDATLNTFIYSKITLNDITIFTAPTIYDISGPFTYQQAEQFILDSRNTEGLSITSPLLSTDDKLKLVELMTSRNRASCRNIAFDFCKGSFMTNTEEFSIRSYKDKLSSRHMNFLPQCDYKHWYVKYDETQIDEVMDNPNFVDFISSLERVTLVDIPSGFSLEKCPLVNGIQVLNPKVSIDLMIGYDDVYIDSDLEF